MFPTKALQFRRCSLQTSCMTHDRAGSVADGGWTGMPYALTSAEPWHPSRQAFLGPASAVQHESVLQYLCECVANNLGIWTACSNSRVQATTALLVEAYDTCHQLFLRLCTPFDGLAPCHTWTHGSRCGLLSNFQKVPLLHSSNHWVFQGGTARIPYLAQTHDTDDSHLHCSSGEEYAASLPQCSGMDAGEISQCNWCSAYQSTTRRQVLKPPCGSGRR
jgi:hypothetical protein